MNILKPYRCAILRFIFGNRRVKQSIFDVEKRAAVARMKDDEVCWCGSGDLWIKCHRGRQNERKRKFREAIGNLNREYLKGYCSHPGMPDQCNEKPIKAHTVQRATALSAIAEDQHVYSPRGRINENGVREIIAIGVHDASTFPGFCGAHDNQMFGYIEKEGVPLDQKSAFLVSYRAMSLETFNRITALRGMLRNKIDAGLPLKQQEEVINKIHKTLAPMKLGLEDLRRWKERLDATFLVEDYREWKMVAIIFDGVLPVVATSVIQPWVDFEGNILQDLQRVKDPSQIVYSLTVDAGRSLLMLCWEQDPQGASERFVDSYVSLSEEHKARAACLMSFVYGENTFFRKGWWDGLTIAQQRRTRQAMAFGTGGVEDKAKVDVVLNPRFSPFAVNVAVAGIVNVR